jgi:ureidoacrylate peracid hydrolase
MKPLQNFSINRRNSILMIVDIENEFCKPGGKMYSELSARIMPGVISSVSRLIERSRSAGIPVVYIQSMRTLKEIEFVIFNHEPVLQIGSWAVDIVDELKPREGDIIVQKFCHDPFFNTKLDNILKKLVTEPTKCYAVVTGGNTNICVYHAAMGLHLRNYLTVVPVDSVFYSSEAGNVRALEQFSELAYPNIFLTRSDLIQFSQV